MRHTLVAVFDNRSDAQNALDELLASGFARTDASLSSADPTGQSNSVTGDNELLDGEREEGFGASIKHFFTGLFGSDTNEHAMKYSYAVTRGHHVLTLTTDAEPEVERAADIIERFGPVDIDERHDQWSRDAGSAGVLGTTAASSGMQQSSSMSAQSGNLGSGSGSSGSYQGTPPGTEPGSLQFTGHDDRNFFATQNINDPVPKGQTYEEPLGASEQSGGSMDSAIGGNTLSGTQSSAQNPATGSSLQSSRSGSLNQSGATLQGTASIPGSDDTSLGGTARVGSSMQRDTGGSVSRGNVRVFSHGSDTSGMSGMSDTYDDYYRNDWNDNYSSLGGSYDDYAPAYRYGNEMRSSTRYRDRSWDEVESDLRSDWESRHPGESTWEKFKAAVRRGWDKITPDIDNDSYYRNHWNAKYSNADDNYDDYLPAYRYGNEARRLQKYRSRQWDDVESDLRTDWESRYTTGPSTWEKFKDAVRHGWDKITPDMDDDSTYYHTHYESTYAASGTDFNDVAPAYRYGNEMRSSDTYRDRDWDDVEHDLRKDWHSRYGTDHEPSAWERIKAAVRHGWERMTGETAATGDDSYYRTHWTNTYQTSGTSYDDMAPAYRYGTQMRNDVRYRNRDWSDVEDDLRADWDTRYGKDGASTWEKMKAAVRHGWDHGTIG
jgi:hypothetical protein